MNPPADNKPVKLAWLLCLIFVTFVLFGAAAVGGNYMLTLRAIHNERAYEAEVRAREDKAAAALRLREAESAVRTGIPTCKAIVKMDDASHGAVNASHSANSYGHRLARAIHDVNETSGCARLIHELDEGWSVQRITLTEEKANNHGK